MTSFRNLKQTTGRKISAEGTDYLFFGGTAYLGLLTNHEYIDLFKKGIDIYGLNNGTSRSNNIQLGIYDEAEHHLANRFGFAAAAVLSSGYLAAQVAVKALTKNKNVIYAPGSHPALWLNSSPEHQENFIDWSEKTIHDINSSQDTDFAIVSNCIDNLTPCHFDFSFLNKILPNKFITLILDDSHGLGILKRNQVSTNLTELNLPNINITVVASLAKGLGTDAGIVLGDKENIALVKKHPIFNGASPSSPAAMYALIHADEIYLKTFERMQTNTNLFRESTKNLNLNHIENFPVFSSKDPFLYKHLLQKNILISSFPYPLASSPLLNRIVVSALHEENDIRHLAEILSLESSLIL